MSRSKKILVVIMAICIVLTAGIVHIVVILSGMGEVPAEWKDYFVLNGRQYYNSYNVIDGSYAVPSAGSGNFSMASISSFVRYPCSTLP